MMPFVHKPIRLKILLAIFAILVCRAVFCVPAAGAAPATRPSSRPAEQRQRYMGELVKVLQGDVLLIHSNVPTEMGNDFAIATDRQTDIRLDGQPATLKDLKPGDSISLITDSAAPMKVVAFSKTLFGIVVRVEGDRLIVTPRESKDKFTEVTVATNEHTQIYDLNDTKDESGRPGRPHPKKIPLNDIKPGMWMSVRPATGVARTIIVEPAPATRPVSKAAAKKVSYECYVGGHVKRAGFYGFPPDRRLTVKMEVVAAGIEAMDGYVQVRRLASPYDPGLLKEIKLKDLFSDPKADMTLRGGEIIIVH